MTLTMPPDPEYTPMNKYQRKLKSEVVDVYDVLYAFFVTCPAIQHAIKKLLMPGARGSKSRVQDLIEARQSIDRAIELAEQEERREWDEDANLAKAQPKTEHKVQTIKVGGGPNKLWNAIIDITSPSFFQEMCGKTEEGRRP